MRIAILSDGFPPHAAGGAEQIAYNFAHELSRIGHTITVITTTRERDLVSETQENGMRIVRIYSNYHPRWRAYVSLYNPATVPFIKAILRDGQFDVVHAHNIHHHISYHALKIAARSCDKVFLTAHDVMMIAYGKLYPRNHDCRNPQYPLGFFEQFKAARLRFNPCRGPILRHYISYVSKIFCVSHSLERLLNQNGITNTMTFHNGIRISEEKISETQVEGFRRRYRLNGRKVILFGGRITPGKGGLYVLKYLQSILPKVPEAMLLIAGTENDTTKRIRAEAEKTGLSAHLAYTGWLTEDAMRCAYHVSDVVIVPSLCLDNFPTVNLEAMASERPVVATCFGGSNESIEEGETGYVANPYDTESFSARISELLTDDAQRAKFGKAARMRVQEYFDISKRALALVELYTHLG